MILKCIDSGNGHTKGYECPVKGKSYYNATLRSHTACSRCGSIVWYNIPELGKSLHSQCLFEVISDKDTILNFYY